MLYHLTRLYRCVTKRSNTTIVTWCLKIVCDRDNLIVFSVRYRHVLRTCRAVGRKFKPVRPNARSRGVVLGNATVTCEQHSSLGTISTINRYGIDNKYITYLISYTSKTEVDCIVPLAKVIFSKTGPAMA